MQPLKRTFEFVGPGPHRVEHNLGVDAYIAAHTGTSQLPVEITHLTQNTVKIRVGFYDLVRGQWYSPISDTTKVTVLVFA